MLLTPVRELRNTRYAPESTAPEIASSSFTAGIGLMKFTVGLKHKGNVNHVVVDAEDALIAALKAKTEHSEAMIMYVRPQNRRGDARHPPLVRAKDTR
jgi:hypothetical protein